MFLGKTSTKSDNIEMLLLFFIELLFFFVQFYAIEFLKDLFLLIHWPEIIDK